MVSLDSDGKDGGMFAACNVFFFCSSTVRTAAFSLADLGLNTSVARFTPNQLYECRSVHKSSSCWTSGVYAQQNADFRHLHGRASPSVKTHRSCHESGLVGVCVHDPREETRHVQGSPRLVSASLRNTSWLLSSVCSAEHEDSDSTWFCSNMHTSTMDGWCSFDAIWMVRRR